MALHLWRAIIGLPALLGYAWLSAACQSEAPRMTPREVREALGRELQLVTLERCTLARYGSAHDGGYLLCKNLIDDLGAVYSYGVGPNDDFDCALAARHNLPVHQYDCLHDARPACRVGTTVFHNECVGPKANTINSRTFDTLANHIKTNGDNARRLIIRMDADGAEWDALMAAPDEVLDQVDQLAIELHGVDEERFLTGIRRLKEHFHLVNLNFDNRTCSPAADPLPASAYKVLLVNKRLGRVDPAAPSPALPSLLNAPDDPAAPDCQPDGARHEARRRQVRETLFNELQPVVLKNCTLTRIGSAYDGGYLMCRNLIEDLGAAYSYGVGPNDEWGCQMSTAYNVATHQYDCFDPARPACQTGRLVFHDECISDRKERYGGRTFDTLANQIAANGDAGKRLIVKIDVEGAEWDALMATPESILEQIDQLPMELHGVNEERFIATVRKLKEQFHLVNLNVNNMSCDPDSAPFPGWAYQVLFVNKRIGVVDPSAPVPAPASPLNALDDPTRPACAR